MKSVRVTGPRRCEVVDVADPHPSLDYAVVRILAAPMCTEYKLYRDGTPSQSPGHEAAGEVVEVAQPGRVRVGDRVVVMPQYPCGRCAMWLGGDYIHCEHTVDPLAATGNTTGRATYAQLVIKPDWLLLPIPGGVSIEHGAMACCGLGPTFGAMEQMKVSGLDTVLITGLGPVGLGGVINARFRGARVIGVESQPYRARLALELGAEAVLDPNDPAVLERIRGLTRGSGADKAIDCSGAAAAQRLAIEAVRRRGQIALVGEGGELAVHVSNDFIRKGIMVRGSWHYPLGEYSALTRVIEGSAAQLDRLITHRFPLARVRDAWELQLTGECGKVILEPGR